MIRWYLACPNVTAKHKFPGTSEFQEKTRNKDIKDKSIKIIPQLTIFWDKHITLRITTMLSRRCSKNDGDSIIK